MVVAEGDEADRYGPMAKVNDVSTGPPQTCDNVLAFVALVKPLDLVKGLRVYTCGPFFFGLCEDTNSSNRKEKHS
jgi:hypothetical protein